MPLWLQTIVDRNDTTPTGEDGLTARYRLLHRIGPDAFQKAADEANDFLCWNIFGCSVHDFGVADKMNEDAIRLKDGCDATVTEPNAAKVGRRVRGVHAMLSDGVTCGALNPAGVVLAAAAAVLPADASVAPGFCASDTCMDALHREDYYAAIDMSYSWYWRLIVIFLLIAIIAVTLIVMYKLRCRRSPRAAPVMSQA